MYVLIPSHALHHSFFFLTLRRPPTSTLFPTRRSSDLLEPLVAAPWSDFQFGEWLRSDFIQGYVSEPERDPDVVDRKSTRLNSSHVAISYAVFCLKKKENMSAGDM